MSKWSDDPVSCLPFAGLPALLLCLFVLLSSSIQAGIDYSLFDYRTTTVFIDDDHNRWIMGASYRAVQASVDKLGMRLKLHFTHLLPDGDLRWGTRPSANSYESGGGKLAGRISFQDEYIQTRISAETSSKNVLVSAGWRRKAGNRNEISASLRLRPFRFLGWGIKRGNIHPLPQSSELYYSYINQDGLADHEGGQIRWLAPAWYTEMKMWIHPLQSAYLEWSVNNADLRPREPRPGESAPGTYLGVFDGFWRDGQVRVKFKVRSGLNATLEYRRIEADMRLRGYDGGRLFTHIGLIDAYCRQWALKVNHHSWSFNLYTGWASCEAGGVMEAWPFVEGLLRFLGERRHFAARADIDWRFISTGGRFWHFGNFFFDGDIDLLHVEPNIRFATWRPLMFGLGIDDLRGERLDLIQADLLRLRIRPTFRWHGVIAEVDASQWIPVYSKKAGYSTESIQQPSGTSMQPATSKKRFWDGFSIMVRLRTGF